MYIKQQQLQIKRNQFETLESLLKEIRNNKKIQSTMEESKKIHPFHEQEKSRNTAQKLIKSKSKAKLAVPFLNLNSLKEESVEAARQHKALTSKRKVNQDSERSHMLEKASSKAGRRYYYDKDSQSASRKNSVQNKNKRLKENDSLSLNNLRDAKEDDDRIETGKQDRPRQKSNENRFQKKDYLQLWELNKGQKSQEKYLQSNDQFQQKQTKETSQKIAQHQSQLQLKQLELQQEYKNNMKQVITYEIEHLKSQLDLLTQNLKQIQTQNSDKYLRIEVVDQINDLKGKKHQVKAKLKTKIDQFWKIAHVQPHFQS